MAPGTRIDRNRPACCAAVENFVQGRHRDAHKRKVAGARSLINNGWSIREELRLQASRKNVKKEEKQDDRFANIERENMRLLLRMQEIECQRRPECGTAGKAAAKIVLGAAQAPLPPKAVARCSSLPAIGRGSNCDARMRELRRIDDENRRMLKRLQGARPTVNNSKMEKQHEAQQRVMRMRQERGPKVPGSRLPLPFSVPPAPAADPEDERLEGLHAELQRRVEELEEMEDVHGTGVLSADQPCSPCSVGSDATRDAGDAIETEPRRQYIGGQLPEHSRLLVEKLMAEDVETVTFPLDHVKLGVDEANCNMTVAGEEDEDAVAKLMAAADALEAQELDPFNSACLSYENVVQRSRAALEARR